jgi:hypothetical protein
VKRSRLFQLLAFLVSLNPGLLRAQDIDVQVKSGFSGGTVANATTFSSTVTFSGSNPALQTTGASGHAVFSASIFLNTFADNPGFNWNTVTTPNAGNMRAGATSNSWHFSEYADSASQWNNGHCLLVACTDPTMFFHSHNVTTREYVAIYDDGTNGFIRAGDSKAGTDSNQAAQGLVLAAGIPTGNANPLPVIIRTAAPRGASGTAASTAVDRVVSGITRTVANNTATTIVSATNASNTVLNFILSYGVEVFDGTNLQYEQGKVSCGVINKAGAWSANTCVKFGNQQGLGSGTLTVTWTITGANPALIQVNANSSLTPSAGYPTVTVNSENLSQQAATFP